jgi:hypothetical protein
MNSFVKILVLLAALGFNLAVAESAFGVRFESTIAASVVTEESTFSFGPGLARIARPGGFDEFLLPRWTELDAVAGLERFALSGLNWNLNTGPGLLPVSPVQFWAGPIQGFQTPWTEPGPPSFVIGLRFRS